MSWSRNFLPATGLPHGPKADMTDCVSLETAVGAVTFDRTRIMGIINVTPDSFCDGGSFSSVEAACSRALEMEQQGADIIDIGGESTRPGSPRVSPDEELRRVVPVVELLAGRLTIPISIDTYKAQVARHALEAGASMVNDVTALRGDPEMARQVGRSKVPVVLMHALWPPATMQEAPSYVDVTEDVLAFLLERAQYAMACGVPRGKIVLDPGIGFGKTLEHNLELLAGIPTLLSSGFPLLVGPSRKSFIGELLDDRPVGGRLSGTAAAVALCAASGAQVVRVHDVAEMRDVVRIIDAVVWQV